MNNVQLSKCFYLVSLNGSTFVWSPRSFKRQMENVLSEPGNAARVIGWVRRWKQICHITPNKSFEELRPYQSMVDLSPPLTPSQPPIDSAPAGQTGVKPSWFKGENKTSAILEIRPN